MARKLYVRDYNSLTFLPRCSAHTLALARRSLYRISLLMVVSICSQICRQVTQNMAIIKATQESPLGRLKKLFKFALKGINAKHLVADKNNETPCSECHYAYRGARPCALTWPAPAKSMTVESFSKTQGEW